MLKSLSLLALSLLSGAATATTTAPAGFPQCGTLVQGVSCILFSAADGNLYILDDFGSFVVGDSVRVDGTFDPGCVSFCMQGVGCIWGTQISSCANPGTAFCFGDGTATACPCGNLGGAGEGCRNSTGSGGVLTTGGSDSVIANDITFTSANMASNAPALLFAGTGTPNGGNGVVFGDGLRCTGGTLKRLGVRVGNSNGEANWGPGIASGAGWSAGDTRHFQGWYRDTNGSPCGGGFNLSHGVTITFTP